MYDDRLRLLGQFEIIDTLNSYVSELKMSQAEQQTLSLL
jgi:hypothetical protein